MNTPATNEVPTPANAATPRRPRQAKLGHPLAYIVWRLPRRITALIGELKVADGDRVLDYGCAEQPYRDRFAAGVEFVGADLAGNPLAQVTLRTDGTLPVEDETFDAILSTQVLEHVADPSLYLAECARVLKPGGRLLLSTHGMMVYHPDPDDYWRWTSSGLVRAVQTSGLTVTHAEGIMGLVAVGIQFIQDGLYFRLPRALRPAFAAIFQPLVAISDRLDRDARPNRNALVHAIIAEKPSTTTEA